MDGKVQRANTLQPSTYENDLCELKCLAMHRPTHELWREVREVRIACGTFWAELTFLNDFAKASRDYPYAWHLHGRKRLWEIRVQMRLKQAGWEEGGGWAEGTHCLSRLSTRDVQVPSSKLYFGIELPDCEAGFGCWRLLLYVLCIKHHESAFFPNHVQLSSIFIIVHWWIVMSFFCHFRVVFSNQAASRSAKQMKAVLIRAIQGKVQPLSIFAR